MRGKLLLVGLGVALGFAIMYFSSVLNLEWANDNLRAELRKAKYDAVMLQVEVDSKNRALRNREEAWREQAQQQADLLRGIQRDQGMQAAERMAEAVRRDYQQRNLESLQSDANWKLEEINQAVQQQNLEQMQRDSTRSSRERDRYR